jgi:hypothetical protein
MATPLRHLSENGLAFLKCAFAAPDFSVDPGKGIPDRFHGRTLSIKDCNTTSITFTPGKDTYLIFAPVPGYAYFKAEFNNGAPPDGPYLGEPFPTFQTNFGNGADVNNKFSKFRYASMNVGLYPTSNMMQFSGSVQCWRVDLNLAETLKQVTTTSPAVSDSSFVLKRIQGLQGVQTLAPRDNYSNSFIKGLYTFAFDKTEDFQWQDFCSATYYQQVGGANGGGSAQKSLEAKDASTALTGLGNTNSIVIKVSTPEGAINTAVLRVWNCIELQPDTNSGLYQYSGVSPELDQLALDLYTNLKMRFPVAMPCDENSKFWETVLRTMNQVFAAGSFLPGPYGIISGGLHTATTALSGLVL